MNCDVLVCSVPSVHAYVSLCFWFELFLQDVSQLTDPDNGFDGINVVAQILWEAFKTRFNTGSASLLLLAIPMGANFICALQSITSASRSGLLTMLSTSPFHHIHP